MNTRLNVIQIQPHLVILEHIRQERLEAAGHRTLLGSLRRSSESVHPQHVDVAFVGPGRGTAAPESPIDINGEVNRHMLMKQQRQMLPQGVTIHKLG